MADDENATMRPTRPPMPAQFRGLSERYHAARRLQLNGELKQAATEFRETARLLADLAKAPSRPEVSALLAELAGRSALEGRDYASASKIAGQALALIGRQLDPDLQAMLAEVKGSALLLKNLPESFRVDWLKLERRDDIDLMVSYRNQITEFLFDASLTSIKRAHIDAERLRLLLPPTEAACSAAAHEALAWAEPPQRELVQSLAFVPNILLEAA